MIKTFDIMLNYYDTPLLLKSWLYRLIYMSDYHKFRKRSQVVIADSGTPLDKLEESLDIVREFFERREAGKELNFTYLRLKSDEIRKTVSDAHAVKMQVQAYNMVILDYSKADMIITSNVGNIVSPAYFNGHVVEHLKSDRAVVLPKRYDLFDEEYHTKKYMKPWAELFNDNSALKVEPSGGWPDLSVRRQWYVEIGGWDEWYKFISPFDMDLGSRLTGKLDNGAPSEALFPGMLSYNNLGLEFVQPYNQDFASLVCNVYPGHSDFVNGQRTGKRKFSYDFGIEYYKANWGKIKRNEDRKPLEFDVLLSRRTMDDGLFTMPH